MRLLSIKKYPFLVFLNYLIVISAFVAGIMVIYVYLNENDRQIENVKNTFYTLRAASIIHLILAILVSSVDSKFSIIPGNFLCHLHARGYVLLAVTDERHSSSDFQCKNQSSTAHLFFEYLM